MNWQMFPFVRILIPVIVGILIGHYFVASIFSALAPVWMLVFLFFFFLVSAAVGVKRVRSIFQVRFGVLSQAWLFVFGLTLYGVHCDELSDNHVLRYLKEVEVRFAENPKEKPETLQPDNKTWAQAAILQVKDKGERWQLTVNLEQVADTAGRWHSVSGRAMVLCEKGKQDSTLLLPGNVVACLGEWAAPQPTRNPGNFDYAAYLRAQNIFVSSYIQADAWEVASDPRSQSWKYVPLRIQRWGCTVFDRYIPEARTADVAKALVLGMQDDIDPAIRTSFAVTGATHVLSVSGLHVGVVLLLIQRLLLLVPIRKHWWKTTSLVLALLGVWSFVLVSGAAPSVTRAGVMITLIMVGRHFNQAISSYNMLAAAAFILLLMNPFDLFSIGFQLSFAALWGIMAFYKPIRNRWTPQERYVRWVWDMTAVSMAAQLATLPFCLYYFQQFPVFFWLSGLIAVPVASGVLYGGIGLLVLQAVPVVARLLGSVLHYGIFLMNECMAWIHHLPGSLVQGIWLNTWQAWVLGIGLVSIAASVPMARLLKRQANFLNYRYAGLVCFIAVLFTYNAELYRASFQERLVVYHTGQESTLDVVLGRQAYTLGGTDKGVLARKSYWPTRRIHKVAELQLDSAYRDGWLRQSGGFLEVAGSTILCFSDATQDMAIPDSPVDVLVVLDNPRVHSEVLLNAFQPRYVVLAASNSWRKAEYIEKSCRQRGIPCHNIKEQGALVLPLRTNKNKKDIRKT